MRSSSCVTAHCDLMLLDLKLAGMNGIRLLHQLRGEGHGIEVIALTATRTSAAVRAVIQRGAIDYVVKPFTVERLRQSLGLFLNRANAFRDEQLDQEAVDAVCASGRIPRRWLPKGLTQEGVTRVRRVLDAQPRAVCSAEVGAAAGLARVTARRYLEYLVTIDQASVEAAPAGPRPSSHAVPVVHLRPPGRRPPARAARSRPARRAAGQPSSPSSGGRQSAGTAPGISVARKVQKGTRADRGRTVGRAYYGAFLRRDRASGRSSSVWV